MSKRLSQLFVLVGLGLLATGCASKFSGEWLETVDSGSDPTAVSLKPDPWKRRSALQFDPIATVRIGTYVDSAGIVDNQTVQSDQYIVYDGGKTAQFGAIVAKLDHDSLTTVSPGSAERHFARHRGKSIFPPRVAVPELAESSQKDTPSNVIVAAR